MRFFRCLAATLLALPLFGQPVANVPLKPGRDAAQPVDEEYTKKIREYTTEPFFNSPLTDYLPASKTVPTPKAVLGDIAGAPGILPYARGCLSLHAHAGEGHARASKSSASARPRKAAR